MPIHDQMVFNTVMTEAYFESFDGTRSGWRAAFNNPRSVFEAHSMEDVRSAIAAAERAAREGRWAVLMLSYEAAPVFDRAMIVHAAGEFPLAWVAVFDEIQEPAIESTGEYQASAWESLISREEYEKAIHSIHRHIEAGDTYQVNYTFPLRCRFAGDARVWHRNLGASQGAKHAAFLDMGRYKILSHSPELFFEREANSLIVRPMKGTAARGRWMEEDEAQARRLAESEKDRAENLMIVDLLRNDLGKVSETGSVRALRLFEIERFRTVLQMTSTIESACKPSTGLKEILDALFPCGSITGAPKISSMRIIRELEPFPRSVYTGAIGLIRPGGDCAFSVAIRTIVIDAQTGEARFGVGGGITCDSTAAGEYDECLVKARFLDHTWPRFQLLETMLLDEGRYFLLERHLRRAASSAAYLGFRWNEEDILDALRSVQADHPTRRWKVRLLVNEDGAASVEVYEQAAEDERLRRVKFASEPINSQDPFIYHKTTHRAVYEKAFSERGDCDDVILWNKRGEATESCFANIIIEIDGQRWTPPRESGLLAGTFRDEMIAEGLARERVIRKEELLRARSFFLINSVQKWMRAVII